MQELTRKHDSGIRLGAQNRSFYRYFSKYRALSAKNFIDNVQFQILCCIFAKIKSSHRAKRQITYCLTI